MKHETNSHKKRPYWITQNILNKKNLDEGRAQQGVESDAQGGVFLTQYNFFSNV